MPWCLKPQATSIHIADWIYIILDQFHTEVLLQWKILHFENYILKKIDDPAV